jgi:carboxyl-terminal processing protease
MPQSKIYWYILPIVLLLGILIGQEFHSYISSKNNSYPSEKINQVLKYAVDYYYEDVDTNALIENAITGILEDLDPHSIYISPDEQLGISEQFRGNFDGIGIEFQIINDTITVVSAIPGGPGESVGIMPGDRIVAIDNNSAIGYGNQEVLAKLRGDKGTSVSLQIYRPYLNQELNFFVIRDQIPLNTVEAAMMVNDSIGYIALSKFVETSTYEMKNALDDLSASGMKRLIIDLRNNPGGYLDQAVNIADLFIEGEKLIVYTKGRIPDFDSEYFARIKYPYEKIPIAVLVNRGSASASEIFTGAIKDWERGIIVGETTFGKGLVQRPFQLEDNSVVRITISKYFTPSGREIQRDFSNEADYFGVVFAEGDHETRLSEGMNDSLYNGENSAEKDSSNKGGIVPDYLIQNQELTYYSIMLRSRDLFFQYARKYLDNNRQTLINSYKNLQQFTKEFDFSKDDIDAFIDFAKKNNVPYVKKEFEKDKNNILQRIKGYIARDIWNGAGWYTIMLQIDDQYLSALELVSKE